MCESCEEREEYRVPAILLRVRGNLVDRYDCTADPNARHRTITSFWTGEHDFGNAYEICVTIPEMEEGVSQSGGSRAERLAPKQAKLARRKRLRYAKPGRAVSTQQITRSERENRLSLYAVLNSI